jgi:hypothetical protein
VTQPAARRYCAGIAPGGDLLMPEFPEEQLAVERYFARTGVLSTYYYWIGVNRTNSSAPYMLSNGGVISQRYSDDLYAHWAAGHYAAAKHPDYNCVLATASLAFDLFRGNPEDDVALLDKALYSTTPTNKYAWAAAVCTGTYNFICQVPAANFGCNPPPSPSPPPPSPPSPPSVSPPRVAMCRLIRILETSHKVLPTLFPAAAARAQLRAQRQHHLLLPAGRLLLAQHQAHQLCRGAAGVHRHGPGRAAGAVHGPC